MTNCIVCGSDDTVPYLRTLLQCSNCNFVFADLNLTDEQFAALYSKNYFFGEEYIDYLTDRKVITKNFELRWNVLRKYVNPQFHQRLFEIGCAYGFFLDLVRNSFNSVEGIDVTSNGIQFAREKLNLNVFC